ncbi:DUF6978 family protein [Schleiferilactobacillus perolens]|uniref:DUF6978 family protein n=1 Tax=Schleiferilactobacillus perolens TaxID=100468 RepID=UPI002352F22B|nr:hypothetical protein [Schleiferilactobacillus perolens]MCI2170125.1 hypothetical protein [Schleiferilactobacillus perolens]
MTSGLDIQHEKFVQLWRLLKQFDNESISLPLFGEQTTYSCSGLFQPAQHFEVLMNRRGHIQRKKLTIIMRSTSSGIMFRYDVVGAPHGTISTPHLHVFDSEHNQGKRVLYGAELGILNVDPTNIDYLMIALGKFLDFNNVEITSVVVNGNLEWKDGA